MELSESMLRGYGLASINTEYLQYTRWSAELIKTTLSSFMQVFKDPFFCICTLTL